MGNKRLIAQSNIKILQVNTTVNEGGAAIIAHDLFEEYKNLGYTSWLAVRRGRLDNPGILIIPRSGQPQYLWARLAAFLKRHDILPGLETRLEKLPDTWAEVESRRGYENFNFPDTWQILGLPPKMPDILHLHNLHGGYFDLRALSYLNRKVPMTLTLHDAWLLSGHCAHSFECKRWKIGCGQCPDLNIYPAVQKDATAFNWRRKQRIYTKCRLYLVTPSHWLMQKVSQSIMAPAMVKGRVIHNGVNLEIFHPADKQATRAGLNIPSNAVVIIFTAAFVRGNPFKDYATLQETIRRVSEQYSKEKVIFLAVGEEAPTEQVGKAEVRFVPYLSDSRRVAEFYQAADIYLHASFPEAENFPNTILEAMACGIPVVATAVGGIPEQVIDEETGFLVPASDPGAMAERISRLLSDRELRLRMGERGFKEVAARFDLKARAKEYIEWYGEVIEDWEVDHT